MMTPLLRWMRRRMKPCCRVCCCWLVMIVVGFCIFASYMNHTNQCSNVESKKIISDLCDLYRRSEVDGSFCHDLCKTETFHFERCTNYKKGKKVLFMSCDNCVTMGTNTKIVMKMHSELDDRARFLVPPIITSNAKDFLREAQSLVKNSFNFLYDKNFTKHQDILSFAWNWDLKEFLKYKDRKLPASKVAVDSIWSLIQQPEYIMYRNLYNNTFIPKIYGTCGPAYFVEHTQTLSMYEFEFFKKLFPTDWKERATRALKLIELMEKFQNMNPEYHLCDIKFDNFGLRDNGEITLLDTDCTMFDENLKLQFKFSNCTTNDDCDFFDCRSSCDTDTGKCLLKRTNNNMQALCEDVFVGYFPKLPTGLLRDPPGGIKVRLFNLLQDCAYPVSVAPRHSTRDRTRNETVERLKTLLYQSINEQ